MTRAGRIPVDTRHRLGLVALALLAAALIPAAVVFACNPQAYLTLDRSAYAPGDSVRVSGSFFRGDTNITVSIDRTGQSSTVRTSSNGSFQTTFALPSSAATGGYTVQAIGYVDGDVIPGLPARASFSVAAPQSAPAAPTPSESGGGGPAPGAAVQPAAPVTQPGAQPAAPQPARPAARPSASRPATAFREPTVFPEPNVQSSLGRRASGSSSAAPTERSSVGGRAVFGGSVAPAVTAPAVTGSVARGGGTSAAPADRSTAARPRGSSQSSQVSPQAAAQTATEDVWSAQTSGGSVLPVAGDGGVAVSSPRTGSQLTLGLLLLGGGVLALVGGLAAGEATRRRVRAR